MISYDWLLSKSYPQKNGLKVFSCFSCGGGSTMGYKLAGYEVIGNVELDKKINEVYKKNHNPKYNYCMDIRGFNKLDNLPSDLYELDILDGSPPCSSFSVSGNRDKDWNKEKYFAEGQKKQILDDLFFYFIDTAKKLKPKIVVTENVKGLVIGKAKGYVKEIIKQFDSIGYNVSMFLLNSAFMGVPQRRERVFFIATRKDLNLPKIKLDFNEKPILFKDIKCDTDNNYKKLSEKKTYYWNNRKNTDKDFSDIFKRLENRNSAFNYVLIKDSKVVYTLTSSCEAKHILYSECRAMNKTEIIRASSFPMDYDFLNANYGFICGMSVPPIMMYKIATEVKKQLLA